MAQSATTVTPVSPTPPTNFACVGERPPTTAGLAQLDDGVAGPLTAFIAPVSGAAHEGAGTEVLVTSPGSRAECPTQMLSDLGNFTDRPNAQHASSNSFDWTPVLDSIGPTPTPGDGTLVTLSATGNFFNKSSVIYLNEEPLKTSLFSQWNITAPGVAKKTSPGTWKVTVRNGGITTPPIDWVFT